MAKTISESIVSNLSYTEKDFQTIYPALLDLVKKETLKWDPSISNESDPGVILIKLNALIADKCNYNIDKNVLECFPLSVTQEKNARQLFEQLGYYMKWYHAAETLVTMKYTAGDPQNVNDTNETITVSYSIPQFTMVCDEEGNSVYTLIDKKTLKSDGTLQTFNALQGVAVDYEVNGEKLITTANLDSNNRLYFDDTNIAENGVFITNSEFNNYGDWKRKDNLLVEEVKASNRFYKFGVTQDLSTCYLEFPENHEELFQEGVYITYIKTQGSAGNVAAGVLDSFYNDVLVVDPQDSSKTVTLNTDNVMIRNYVSGLNGSDSETINDAYLNYKKTIGTFETLITLRDYMNAVANSEFVSNAKVSDRTCDVQSSYGIMTESGSISQLINEVEEATIVVQGYFDGSDFWEEQISASKYKGLITPDVNKNYMDIPTGMTYRVIHLGGQAVYIEADPEEKVALSAFDLKMYILTAKPLMNSATNYNTTFVLDNSDSTYTAVESEIDSMKTVQHNFIDLLPNKLCFIKNRYPVACKITPQYVLTDAQKDDMAKNIRYDLYEALNSSKLQFGQEIVFEDVYNVILNSDSRIKDLYLDALEYTTYGVYLDDNGEVKEVNISDYVTYYNMTYNMADKLVSTAKNVEYDIPITIINARSEFVGSASGIEFKIDTEHANKFSVYLLDYWETDPETSVEEFCIYENNKWVDNPTAETLSKYQIFKIFGNLETSEMSGLKKWLGNNSSSKTQDTYLNLDDTSKANDFRIDIYSKSVLAGKTKFFVKDTKFDYGINQKYQLLEDNVGRLTTNLKVDLTSANQWQYTVRNNEVVQFFAPNLLESNNYSSNIRFEHSIQTVIPAKTTYKLKANEYIIFYWLDDSEIDSSYNYAIYGEGAIIQPTFVISKPVDTDKLVGNSLLKYVEIVTQNNQSYQYASGDTSTEDISLTENIKNLTNAGNILSGTRKVTQYLINTEFINSSKIACYWILNEQENGRYVLFDEYSGPGTARPNPRILKSGEYFIYSDAVNSHMEILGAGTQITRGDSSTSKISCVAMDFSEIAENGLNALADYWVYLPNGYQLTLMEMQYIALGESTVVSIVPSDGRDLHLNSESATSLEGCTIKYKENKGSTTWTTIGSIILNDSKLNWQSKTLLRLNTSVGTPQTLLEGHSLKYFKYDGAENRQWIVEDTPEMREYYEDEWDNWKPGEIVVGQEPFIEDTDLLTSRLINAIGPTVSTIDYDENDKAIPLSIYAYLWGDMDDGVIFLDDGSTQILFMGDEEKPETLDKIQSKKATFKLPGGNYIMPVNHITEDDVINRLNFFLYPYNIVDAGTLEDINVVFKDTVTTSVDMNLSIGINIKDGQDILFFGNSLKIELADSKTKITLSNSEDSLVLYENNAWVNSKYKHWEFFSPVYVDMYNLQFINWVNDNAGTDANGGLLIEKLLTPMGGNGANLYKAGYYYLRIDYLKDKKADSTFFITVRAEIEYCEKPKTYEEVPVLAVVIPPIFKYSNSDALNKDVELNAYLFQRIAEHIRELDYHHIFDYTYVVNEDEEIKDPLAATSYLNALHVMNPYTICQMSTDDDTSIYITNTSRG